MRKVSRIVVAVTIAAVVGLSGCNNGPTGPNSPEPVQTSAPVAQKLESQPGVKRTDVANFVSEISKSNKESFHALNTVTTADGIQTTDIQFDYVTDKPSAVLVKVAADKTEKKIVIVGGDAQVWIDGQKTPTKLGELTEDEKNYNFLNEVLAKAKAFTYVKSDGAGHHFIIDVDGFKNGTVTLITDNEHRVVKMESKGDKFSVTESRDGFGDFYNIGLS